MIVLQLTKNNTTMMCLCGQRHTYNFNFGGVNSAPEPFTFKPNDTITFRFDDDGQNLGNGPVETLTLDPAKFLDMTNVSADEMAAYLNTVLVHGRAFNDFGTVLVQSKTPGPTSCAEVLDGDAAKAMGYNVRGSNFEHFCCGRMVLGYSPPVQEKHAYTEIIMLRRCNACKGQPTTVRHMKDYSNDPDWSGNVTTRKAINTLAIYLKGNGYVDPDLVDFYASETSNPPEYFPEFFGQVDTINVAQYEDLLKIIQNK